MERSPVSPRKVALWVGTLTGGGLFLYQVWHLHQATTQIHFQAPYRLFFALLAGITAYLLLLLGWSHLLHNLGISIEISQIAQGYFISFLPRYLPGSVWGYLGRNEWFKQMHNVAYKDTSRASLLETLWVILTASIFILGWWLSQDELSTNLTLPVFIGLLAFISSLILFVQPYVQLSGITSLYIYTLVWCFQGIAAWYSIQAIEPSLHPSLFGTIAIISTGWLIGFVAIIIPAGIGVREWAIASLLTHYLALPSSLAEFTAVTFRIIMTLSELIWLATGLYLHSRSPNKK